MSSSGTYAFNPSIGDLTNYAFQLAGLRGTSLVTEHWQSARMGANMLLIDWANDGPTLFTVDLVTVALVQGQATYAVDPNTITILDAYMTIDNGISPAIDRIITPVSRSEYASYPQKQMQGFTTVYWLDRTATPTVTLWPVPDGASAQYLKYYRFTQIQDADFTSGQTLGTVYRYLNAFAEGLALKLARIWNPALAEGLAISYAAAYALARTQDTEGAGLYVSPMLSGYYRP